MNDVPGIWSLAGFLTIKWLIYNNYLYFKATWACSQPVVAYCAPEGYYPIFPWLFRYGLYKPALGGPSHRNGL